MSHQLHHGSAERATLRLLVDGAEAHIATLQSGQPGEQAVLLVPGYTGSKEDFAPILDPLAAAGWHATAMDLPGQFESPGLPAPDDYTPDNVARYVRAVAATLGEQVHLLGHSFGGLVARAAVMAEPSRFASLVLLSSGPAQLDGVRRLRIEQMEPVLAGSGLPGVYAAMLAAAESEPGFAAPPPDLAEFLERRFLGGSPAMLEGMGHALRHEPDRVAELAATGIRILVAHGRDDDAWPPAVQHEMAVRLGADYAVIADSAHSPAVENPVATVEALVAFWKSIG